MTDGLMTTRVSKPYCVTVRTAMGGSLTYRVRASTMNEALRRAFPDPDVPDDALSVTVEPAEHDDPS